MSVTPRFVRRVTNDIRHNAFTGACWFKGNLYLAYRQGDAGFALRFKSSGALSFDFGARLDRFFGERKIAEGLRPWLRSAALLWRESVASTRPRRVSPPAWRTSTAFPVTPIDHCCRTSQSKRRVPSSCGSTLPVARSTAGW